MTTVPFVGSSYAVFSGKRNRTPGARAKAGGPRDVPPRRALAPAVGDFVCEAPAERVDGHHTQIDASACADGDLPGLPNGMHAVVPAVPGT